MPSGTVTFQQYFTVIYSDALFLLSPFGKDANYFRQSFEGGTMSPKWGSEGVPSIPSIHGGKLPVYTITACCVNFCISEIEFNTQIHKRSP